MPANPTPIGLRLDPLDPVLFRDGRPFDAASRVSGGLPNPQTLAGALRTAMLAQLDGFHFRRFAAARGRVSVHEALREGGAPDWWFHVRFRGPWPAVTVGDVVEPLFEKPATLYKTKAGAWDRAVPLEPNQLPGWDDRRLRPVWKKAEPDPKAEGGYLTLTGLRQFLDGPPTAVEPAEIVPRRVLFDDDDRIGIEIDKHALTSAEGMLYAVRFLSLNRNLRHDPADGRRPYPERFDGGAACFYAEVVLPTNATKTDFFAERTPVPFGGEGKYVGATRVKECPWPEPPANRKTAVWYLASPAFLSREHPDGPPLPEKTWGDVVAAASGPGIAVSGWDVARTGPRPTRFAVPAGAVYFVENLIPPELDSLDPNRDNQLEGWGFALRGTW